jgi:hypothetical protein
VPAKKADFGRFFNSKFEYATAANALTEQTKKIDDYSVWSQFLEVFF